LIYNAVCLAVNAHEAASVPISHTRNTRNAMEHVDYENVSFLPPLLVLSPTTDDVCGLHDAGCLSADKG
jgi:hypothetical protein